MAPAALPGRSRRLDVLLGVRAALALAVVAAAAVPGSTVGAAERLVAAAGLHLVLVVGGEVLLRQTGRVALRQRALVLGLAADVAFVAVAVQAAGGPLGVLGLLPVGHVVAITLLASYRSGLRVAVAHAGLLVLARAAQQADLLPGPFDLAGGEGKPTIAATTIAAAGFLAVALVTAACSAVNEAELRAQARGLACLVDLARALDLARTRAEVAAAGVDRLQAMGFRRAACLLRDADGGLVAGPAGAVAAPCPSTLAEQAAAAGGLVTRRALDPAGDAVLAALLPDASGVVAVPLVAEGEVVGALVAEWGATRGGLPARTAQLLTQAASHLSLALRAAALGEAVERQARTDGLTGLVNRRELDRLLAAHVQRADAGGEPVAVLLVDLDHFKQVNDRHGHQAGDDVLRHAGAALLATVRPGDVAARYGGEELAVVAPGCGPEEAEALAERLRAAIREGAPVPVTASLGVAVAPAHGHDPTAVVAAADAALYAAKRGGRDRTVVAGAAVAELIS